MAAIVAPHTPDLAVTAVRRSVEDLRRTFASTPLVNGTLLTDVSIAAGDTTLDHGLGRQWQGYFVTRVASGTPAQIQTATTQPQDATVQLAVTSASAFVADVWVF